MKTFHPVLLDEVTEGPLSDDGLYLMGGLALVAALLLFIFIRRKKK